MCDSFLRCHVTIVYRNKEETSKEKKAKSERMTDKGKAMRGKAFRTRESDEDEDDSDDDAKEKGAGGDPLRTGRRPRARFLLSTRLTFAHFCRANDQI